MSTATMPNSNVKRKHLSDQLDRLDSILDGLSDALNGAVADAAREGTRLAVKDAVIAILTDPALRALLSQATAPEPAAEAAKPEKKPGWWARLKAQAGQAVKSVGRMASNVVDGAIRGVKAVANASADAARTIRGLGSLKKLALVGLAFGVTLGVASYVAPHAVAAALSGISGAVAGAAVQVSVWTRRAFRRLAMV